MSLQIVVTSTFFNSNMFPLNVTCMSSPGHGPVWLDHVVCTGNELSIVDCAHSNFSATSCTHDHDASVQCNVPDLKVKEKVIGTLPKVC